ncbi:hypothetical protein [Haloarchaeobius sp. TZWWS8]|uniref:hypothetical protein n=1 Tax=Haloarchaeobius sp. TZWWS8 TaxID=3446121 RepID=UPI003EC01A29
MNRVNWPTWLMVFSPSMVEQYGREWVRDLPAAHIEEFDDGAILVIATDEFVNLDSSHHSNLDISVAEMISKAMKPIEAAFEALSGST